MSDTDIQYVSYAVIALSVIGLFTWFFSRKGVPAGGGPQQVSDFVTPVLPTFDQGALLGTGGVLAAVMLLIFSLVSWGSYFSASTVLQQIAALLTWIGNCVFWGIFIIVSAIHTRK